MLVSRPSVSAVFMFLFEVLNCNVCCGDNLPVVKPMQTNLVVTSQDCGSWCDSFYSQLRFISPRAMFLRINYVSWTTKTAMQLWKCLFYTTASVIWTSYEQEMIRLFESHLVLCAGVYCLWKWQLLLWRRTALLSFTNFELHACCVSIQSFKCILWYVGTVKRNWTAD